MSYLKTEEEMLKFIGNLSDNVRFSELFLNCKEENKEVFFNFCGKHKNLILKNILNFKSNIPIDNAYNLMLLLRVLPFLSTSFAKQNKDKIENYISSNLNKIDPEIYSMLLKDLLECCKVHSFIYEFLDNHLEFIAIILANKKLKVLKEEKVLDTYVELIKDVFRIENANIYDLNLKNGSFSNVLIIKNKVIKSGGKITKKIPYHKRLLQPIIRQNITSINNHNVDFDFIEVYERTLPYKNVGVFCYDVFKEMLDDGILWSDPKDGNLGILIKPNVAFIENSDNGEPLFIDDEAVNIFDNRKKEILEKGEVVVIDLDFIYDIKNIINRDLIKRELMKNPNLCSRYFFDIMTKHNIRVGNFALLTYFERYIDGIKEEIKNIKK